MFYFFRDAAHRAAQNEIRIITMKLNSAAADHQAERERWQKNLENVEESWRGNIFINYFD